MLQIIHKHTESYPGLGINIGMYDSTKWQMISHGYTVDRKIETSNRVYYDIASLTKTFTATAILELIQNKKIKLDQPVTDFLPHLVGLHNIENKPITIRNLLTHTTGLMLIGDSGTVFDKRLNYTKSEIEKVFFTASHLYQIDLSRTNYMCINHIYLGRILEIVLKQPLDDIIHLMLHKLDINEITFNPLEHDIKEHQVAKSEYLFANDQIAPAGIVQDEKARAFGGISGNAGLFSTLIGLNQWVEAWMENRLGFDADLYQSSFYFDNKNINLDVHFGLVWRNGKITTLPNMSGFSGCTVVIDPLHKKALTLTTNSTFPDRSKRLEILGWTKTLIQIWTEN